MSLRMTGTGAGAILSLVTLLLFSVAGLICLRRKAGAGFSAGEILNVVGFGLLPAIAVWKIFEQGTSLGIGTAVFVLPETVPWITERGCFAVSRIEMILAALIFAAVILWLVLRKEDLPGNGDLLLTVLCVWGLIRAFTETLRERTLLRAGSVNLIQILLLAAVDITFIVWTVRLDAAQKNTAIAALEWIAVISCEAVLVLNTADILSSGNPVGDLAVNAGCVILCMLLMLLAGKDSRS